ncbi:hypothetical protein [Compostimonas suwonensis]|nr:hypothetical protein [Compostimonas suwonensis]
MRSLHLSPWWWGIHAATILVAALVFVRVGGSQWFYYDEWDFLVERQEWDLLTPHNGHLSFAPALITTLIKLVVGLHSYWPFLAVTIVVHLALVHVLWRLMVRLGAQPLIAILVAFTLAVLGAGAENTLWAFQTGFIAPLLTGILALFVVFRASLRKRDVAAVALLLLLGLSFASTGIPMVVGVVVFLLVRHGWRKALVVAAAVGVVYGTWFLLFNTGSQAANGYKASNATDFLVGMSQFVSHGFIDSLAAVVPFEQLAGALLVLFCVWMVVSVSRGGLRRVSPAHYLTLAALVFAALTAYTRVQLGVGSASSGRYVYVYFALLAPAAALCLTALIRRSRIALGAVAALLAVVAVYNVGMLNINANTQAAVEQFTKEAMSAAVDLDDGTAEAGQVHPMPVIAPPLTLDDIRAFVARGEFTPGEVSEPVMLSTEINMELKALPVDPGGAAPTVCAPADGQGFLVLDRAEEGGAIVWASADLRADVRAVDDGITSNFTVLRLSKGFNEIDGVDAADIALRAQDGAALCVPAAPSGE